MIQRSRFSLVLMSSLLPPTGFHKSTGTPPLSSTTLRLTSIMPPLELLHLPPELLIHILHSLSAKDLLLSVQLVNVYLHDLVRGASILQYIIEVFHAGFEDNAYSNTVYAERLHTLRQSETSWNNIDPVRKSTLVVSHPTSGLYDLSAGIYVVGERGQGRRSTALRYTYLPSNSGRAPWKKIDVGPERHIIDFGISVREHDLIALVTA